MDASQPSNRSTNPRLDRAISRRYLHLARRDLAACHRLIKRHKHAQEGQTDRFARQLSADSSGQDPFTQRRLLAAATSLLPELLGDRLANAGVAAPLDQWIDQLMRDRPALEPLADSILLDRLWRLRWAWSDDSGDDNPQDLESPAKRAGLAKLEDALLADLLHSPDAATLSQVWTGLLPSVETDDQSSSPGLALLKHRGLDLFASVSPQRNSGGSASDCATPLAPTPTGTAISDGSQPTVEDEPTTTTPTGARGPTEASPPAGIPTPTGVLTPGPTSGDTPAPKDAAAPTWLAEALPRLLPTLPPDLALALAIALQLDGQHDWCQPLHSTAFELCRPWREAEADPSMPAPTGQELACSTHSAQGLASPIQPTQCPTSPIQPDQETLDPLRTRNSLPISTIKPIPTGLILANTEQLLRSHFTAEQLVGPLKQVSALLHGLDRPADQVLWDTLIKAEQGSRTGPHLSYWNYLEVQAWLTPSEQLQAIYGRAFQLAGASPNLRGPAARVILQLGDRPAVLAQDHTRWSFWLDYWMVQLDDSLLSHWMKHWSRDCADRCFGSGDGFKGQAWSGLAALLLISGRRDQLLRQAFNRVSVRLTDPAGWQLPTISFIALQRYQPAWDQWLLDRPRVHQAYLTAWRQQLADVRWRAETAIPLIEKQLRQAGIERGLPPAGVIGQLAERLVTELDPAKI
ncbi:MAG: hypothetical protein LBV30_09020 [Propionibacteriaceae bacterium]|nr:hypothetical protein [Propionibacteriaceae bacterium]